MTCKLFSEYDHFDNSVINRFNSTPISDCFLFAASVRAFSKHLALYSTGTQSEVTVVILVRSVPNCSQRTHTACLAQIDQILPRCSLL